MGFQAVTADADNSRVGILECRVGVPETDAFSRASWGVVLWVEIDDKVPALVIRKIEGLDGGFSREVWNRLVHAQCFV